MSIVGLIPLKGVYMDWEGAFLIAGFLSWAAVTVFLVGSFVYDFVKGGD